MEMVALGSDKKWLWSEKKISVSSGSLCPLVMMRHSSPPKKAVTALGWGVEGGMPLSTHNSKTCEERGWAKGVGKDNPNRHLEDILPGTPKLITVPRWH